MNRPTRLLALPVVALVAFLGACGNPPERAATVGTDTPATKAAEATKEAPKPRGAGDKLVAKKAKAAILAVGDMPTGWAAGEVGPDKKDTSTLRHARSSSTR